MTFSGWATIFLFVLILSALAFPLGNYMAKVYTGQRVFLTPVFGWAERGLYRVMRVDPRREQDWKQYAKSLIIFSLAGWLLLYFILRTQDAPWVPHFLNPLAYHSAPWNVTFNTTSSFLTNTNWQFYSGETTMSYFSQMLGLTVQNWLSAGIGIVVAVALVRGIIGRSGKGIGNFWQDLIRTILYVLAPITVIGAILLVSQGVIANFATYLTAHTITGLKQTIAMGPVASQLSIKMLGTNGGGFFNTNSAHPFENPSGFTNFLEMSIVLIIPAALIFMYGRMTGNRRQGYAIYATVMIMFLGAVIVAYIAEAHGSPAQHAAGLHTGVIAGSGGGNMEGKEQRFGIAGSALFDVVTTVTSCGAVNSALESFTGIGGAVPFANLSASEVIFGGVGTGLYSILLYVLLAVFIGGLMVGRTPEWLGKKIEAREIKLAGLGILITPLAALFGTALATASRSGRASISEGALTSAGKLTPQGFSETFYAYLSQANNNGSAFAGYTGFIQPSPGSLGSHGVSFADLLGGFDMLFARYVPILFALAVAGALAGKRVTPAGLGTMRTDNATFVVLLIGVIILVGALTFFPALLLGPIVRGHDGTPLLEMRKDIITSAIGIIVLTLLLGFVYPLFVTGVSQVAFPGNANGQRVYVGGRLVGSKLIGQNFGTAILEQDGKPKEVKGVIQTEPDPRYFQSRPSATEGGAYNAASSSFSNHGPNSVKTKEADEENIKAYLELNKNPVTKAEYDPGLTVAQIPVDAVNSSASGLDPEISQANAWIQAHRIASVRHLPLAEVDKLIGEYTSGRGLGFSGEPGVNVLELNLALNRLEGKAS